LFRAGKFKEAQVFLDGAAKLHEEELKELASGLTLRRAFKSLGGVAAQDNAQAQEFMEQFWEPGDHAASWFFLAMTYHQLKQPKEAGEWLKKATTLLDQAITSGNRGTAPLTWQQRVELQLLRAEAEKMIEGSPR